MKTLIFFIIATSSSVVFAKGGTGGGGVVESVGVKLASAQFAAKMNLQRVGGQVDALSNISLRTSAGNDGFAKCIAQAALDQVILKNRFYDGFKFQNFLGTGVEEMSPPFETATLDFVGGTATQNAVFTIRIRTLDTDKAWQLEQASSGEIYPYTTSAETTAGVEDAALRSGLGEADISFCPSLK